MIIRKPKFEIWKWKLKARNKRTEKENSHSNMKIPPTWNLPVPIHHHIHLGSPALASSTVTVLYSPSLKAFKVSEVSSSINSTLTLSSYFATSAYKITSSDLSPSKPSKYIDISLLPSYQTLFIFFHLVKLIWSPFHFYPIFAIQIMDHPLCYFVVTLSGTV
jgi:hypothetical protein